MTTQETRRVEEDLTYIRGAVERMERGPYQSVTIAAIWAVIVAVGFSINDFRPEISMVYWPVAAIGGYLICLAVLVIGLNHGWNGPVVGQLFTLVSGAGCLLGPSSRPPIHASRRHSHHRRASNRLYPALPLDDRGVGNKCRSPLQRLEDEIVR